MWRFLCSTFFKHKSSGQWAVVLNRHEIQFIKKIKCTRFHLSLRKIEISNFRSTIENVILIKINSRFDIPCDYSLDKTAEDHKKSTLILKHYFINCQISWKYLTTDAIRALCSIKYHFKLLNEWETKWNITSENQIKT